MRDGLPDDRALLLARRIPHELLADQEGLDPTRELVGGKRSDLLAVERGQLLDVERGRVVRDGLEREQLHELVEREPLAHTVARRPPEQREVVHERLGKVAVVAVPLNRGLAVPLRERLTVRADDERQVAELRPARTAERPVDKDLLGRRRHQVRAADDVRDVHSEVVVRRREHIQRGPVGARECEVLDVGVERADLTEHEILEDRLWFVLGNLEPQDPRTTLGVVRGGVDVREVATRVAARRRLPLLAGLLVTSLALLGRAVATERVAFGQQLVGRLFVEVHALGLAVRRVVAADLGALVPLEAQPSQDVHDLVDVFVGDPRPVGVLDPEDERSAVMPGEQPVEEGASRVADVERATRRRREPHANLRRGAGHGRILSSPVG